MDNINNVHESIRELSKEIIGVIKVDTRFHLVTKFNSNDNTVSCIWISTFGTSYIQEYMPINKGKLVLFSRGRTLYDMIETNKYEDFLKRNYGI